MTDESPARRFASTESYYAEHRPGYGDALFEFLAERFALGDESRVLDLGCGAGQTTLPLAERAGHVLAMDPNEEMVRHARRRASEAGVETVEWVVGSDADLRVEMGPFRLTVMGRSFHWMDQERTLDRLFRATEPGGGVALVTDREWLTKGQANWQAAVYEVTEQYLDDLPERVDPAAVSYDDPWDEKLRAFGFEDVETLEFDLHREWPVDGIVGYVFSLSYCSPDRFGGDAEAFETDLRARLTAFDRERFEQRATVEAIVGSKPTDGDRSV
ncbi:class I SAM-dependent methyltransferase [Halomarina oriensis]|uniref:class I SAM-dependent methyltransferase n=1 Tax=Halomarina oriensis TaxID=671145 RepID=UPI001E385798|nr:class I SAM-dependent methyltransferase [Halomarina oriensis]